MLTCRLLVIVPLCRTYTNLTNLYIKGIIPALRGKYRSHICGQCCHTSCFNCHCLTNEVLHGIHRRFTSRLSCPRRVVTVVCVVSDAVVRCRRLGSHVGLTAPSTVSSASALPTINPQVVFALLCRVNTFFTGGRTVQRATSHRAAGNATHAPFTILCLCQIRLPLQIDLITFV